MKVTKEGVVAAGKVALALYRFIGRNHIHQGKALKVGDEVMLTERQAKNFGKNKFRLAADMAAGSAEVADVLDGARREAEVILETTTTNAKQLLATAQEEAEAIVNTANVQAEQIVALANENAKAIEDAAKAQADQIVADALKASQQ